MSPCVYYRFTRRQQHVDFLFGPMRMLAVVGASDALKHERTTGKLVPQTYVQGDLTGIHVEVESAVQSASVGRSEAVVVIQRPEMGKERFPKGLHDSFSNAMTRLFQAQVRHDYTREMHGVGRLKRLPCSPSQVVVNDCSEACTAFVRKHRQCPQVLPNWPQCRLGLACIQRSE